MPARPERIILVPAEGGQPVRVMKFPFWWDRGAIRDLPRTAFRRP
jgi:hypothetical protein